MSDLLIFATVLLPKIYANSRQTPLLISSTVRMYQLNTYNKVNLFNHIVKVIATIFWETQRPNTAHPTRGIYFLIHVHNYTKLKGLDFGKIM